MLLSDVEPELYQEEIALIVDGMLQGQRPNGCLSYHPYTYDDTSQTQYAVLCLWTAAQNGYQVPADVAGTRGELADHDATSGGRLVLLPLEETPDSACRRNYAITHSMTSAGAGMIYMLATCSDWERLRPTCRRACHPR